MWEVGEEERWGRKEEREKRDKEAVIEGGRMKNKKKIAGYRETRRNKRKRIEERDG